ncbi:MAG: hypothetical protein ACRDYU_09970 [Actinomycetes bacterium]
MTSPTRRSFAALASAALALGAATACSSEGATTDCSTSACTITYERGVDAQATILGVQTRLVGVDGDRARIKVAGQTLTLPAGGQAQAGEFTVSVQDVSADEVVVKVAQSGG